MNLKPTVLEAAFLVSLLQDLEDELLAERATESILFEISVCRSLLRKIAVEIGPSERRSARV